MEAAKERYHAVAEAKTDEADEAEARVARVEEERNAAVDAESARVYGAQQHAAELERHYEALRRAQACACSGILCLGMHSLGSRECSLKT